MKIVYGTPNTSMAVGVGMLGNVPTPFFSFIDKEKMAGFDKVSTGDDAMKMIEFIESVGGVVVFVENPEAAHRMNKFMHCVFDSAIDGEWGDVKEAEGATQ